MILFHGCVVSNIAATPQGGSELLYASCCEVTRGIASFASLIRSSPRYVAGTPKGVLAIPYRYAYWTGVTMTKQGAADKTCGFSFIILLQASNEIEK